MNHGSEGVFKVQYQPVRVSQSANALFKVSIYIGGQTYSLSFARVESHADFRVGAHQTPRRLIPHVFGPVNIVYRADIGEFFAQRFYLFYPLAHDQPLYVRVCGQAFDDEVVSLNVARHFVNDVVPIHLPFFVNFYRRVEFGRHLQNDVRSQRCAFDQTVLISEKPRYRGMIVVVAHWSSGEPQEKRGSDF
ncbi:40 kDa protein [Grouper iridovirus]|uniref:40 kDa protein n=1 Tax=Grouper iridovirus TaxID=127569 RepID=Q5GAD0_9VIRU|nr:40 kDa protein [Grouper iridovirus]